MAGGKIKHWKHGWIPISPQAKAFVAGRGPRPVSSPGTRSASVDFDTVASAERLRDAGVEYGTRSPEYREAQVEAFKPLFLPGFEDIAPKLAGKINARLEALTGRSESDLAADVQANLENLYRTADKSNADWYEKAGAENGRIAAAISDEFDVELSREQFTGMVSATSALMPWRLNTPFAESIARVLAANEPFEVTQEMMDDYNRWADTPKKQKAGLTPLIDIEPGTYRPSELPTAFAASKTPGMPKAINQGFVIKAAQIFKGEQTLDEVVGGPKQRSFINNLMDPDDDDYVTMDTWQYRASMAGIKIKSKMGGKEYDYTLEEWADMDLAVADGRAVSKGYDPAKGRYDPANKKAAKDATLSPQDLFQGVPTSVADNYKGYGTYPWFVQQIQIVAERLGITPNALQAVVWYEIGGGL